LKKKLYELVLLTAIMMLVERTENHPDEFLTF